MGLIDVHRNVWIAAIVASCLLGVLLLIEISNLCQTRLKIINQSGYRNSTLLLFGSTSFALVCFSLLSISWSLNWTGNPDGCTALVKLNAVVYLMSKHFILMFLYVRMKIVHDALRLNHLLMKLTRWAVFLSINLGMPFVFYPIAAFVFQGVVDENGICGQYSISEIGVLFFVVSDFALSSTMLFLFIIPLTKHTRVVPGEKTQVLKIARRNLIVSLFMHLFSLSTLIFVANIASQTPTGGNIGPYVVLSEIVSAFDAFFGVMACHSLCANWVPASIYKKMQTTQGPEILTGGKPTVSEEYAKETSIVVSPKST